jgi:putative transposase
VKYCPALPKTFASLGQARAFCASFFDAYNNHHRHAGLGLLTPNVVHTGQAERVRAARAVVLNAAHARHTNRFSHPPQPPRLPEPAWTNRPENSEAEAHK